MSSLNEQFDVFSNSLRLLPEQIVRLSYFFKEIDEPEEGISNVEVAYKSVLSNVYGLMSALKDAGACASIYEHDAITTLLCIRHVVEHQPGRLRNNLRDAWSKRINGDTALVRYNASDESFPQQPFFLNIAWFQSGIANSNNTGRLPKINAFWNLDNVRAEVERRDMLWTSSYVCAMALITEAIRTIVHNYGHLLTADGYDSTIYLSHFKAIKPVDARDYCLD